MKDRIDLLVEPHVEVVSDPGRIQDRGGTAHAAALRLDDKIVTPTDRAGYVRPPAMLPEQFELPLLDAFDQYREPRIWFVIHRERLATARPQRYRARRSPDPYSEEKWGSVVSYGAWVAATPSSRDICR